MQSLPLVACLVLAVAFAGCHEDVAEEEAATYVVSGAFTDAATQEDIDALRQEMGAMGGDLIVMESFPMQYQVRDLTQDTCEAVRELLAEKAYVATVGACRSVSATTDGDTPTGTGA